MAGQLFFDRGEHSFMAEAIQILRPIKFHMDIRHADNAAEIDWPEGKTVRIQFEGTREGPISEWVFACTVFGRSYGECLYQLRERLRQSYETEYRTISY